MYDSKDKEKYTILSNFVVFIFMNSSATSMLQRKMLKVSMASGEAEGKKNTDSGVCFENPFEIHICSAVALLMSQLNIFGFPAKPTTRQATCGLGADASASP